MIITVVACAAPNVPRDTSPSPARLGVLGGRFVEGALTDIKTLQPVLVNDAPSATVTGRIYESLLQADPRTGEVGPNLARWTVSADGLTYSWDIEAAATWSDGKPIIAQDVLTGMVLVAKSKKTSRKTNFNDVVGFKELAAGKSAELAGFRIDPANAKRFTVTLTAVFCPALMNVFGGNLVLPTQVFGKYATKDSGDEIDTAPENDNPRTASGPFKLKEWKKGDQVVLDRNPGYWKGPPLLDQYIYQVVADQTVLLSQLRSGQLTYATIDPKDQSLIAKVGTLQITEYQQLSYSYIGWNVRSAAAPALRDKRIRQALAYGLDIDLVMKDTVSGRGTKKVAHHPSASWAAPRAALEPYAYDRAKAAALIESAGYVKGLDGFYSKDGKLLAFSIVAIDARESMLKSVTDQYKAIGVKVTPRLETFETMVDKLETGSPEIEAWIISWSLSIEPDPFLIWSRTSIPDVATRKTGYNFGGFTTPGMEETMQLGRTPKDGDCSPAARKKAYETFDRILNDEQPYNFGFAPHAIAVSQKNLREFRPDTFGVHWNIERWWIQR